MSISLRYTLVVVLAVVASVCFAGCKAVKEIHEVPVVVHDTHTDIMRDTIIHNNYTHVIERGDTIIYKDSATYYIIRERIIKDTVPQIVTTTEYITKETQQPIKVVVISFLIGVLTAMGAILLILCRKTSKKTL